jgi:hypothetical protein
MYHSVFGIEKDGAITVENTLRSKAKPPVLSFRYGRHMSRDSCERVVEAGVGVIAQVPDGGTVGICHPTRDVG